MSDENVELLLLHAVLSEKNISPLLTASPFLVAYDREAEFIIAEYDATKRLPTVEGVDIAFNGFANCTPTESANFYLERILERRSRVDLQNFIQAGHDLLKNHPTAEQIQNYLMSAPIPETAKSSLVRWDGASSIEGYLTNTRRGNVVTDFPWAAINAMCGELRRGQYMSLCGRPKMGKTFVAQYLVHHAWVSGIEPLVLSGEMTVSEMQGRFDCIDAKIDAGKYYRGTLSPTDSINLIRVVRRRTKKKNAIIFNDRDLYSLADVQASLAITQCPLVFVDGAYLFESGLKGRGPTEIMVQISRTLKRMAKRFNVALIATFQQNRQAEGKPEGGGANSISWGDTVLMDSDIIFEVICKRERTDKFRKLQDLGARNSGGGYCYINYKPSPNSDFSQINSDFILPDGEFLDEA